VNTSSPKGMPGMTGPKNAWQAAIQQVNQLLIPVREAVIILSPQADFDAVASGLALFTSLKKIGRISHIVSPEKLNTEKIFAQANIKPQAREMIPVDQIVSFLPQKQLRLIIDYAQGSYSHGDIKEEGDSLTLKLLSEKGQPPIKPLNMATQIVESKPDVIFVMGVENIYNMGDFYSSNSDFFGNTPMINIDNHSSNTKFGKVNLLDDKASSLSEMVTLMLYDLRFVLDEDTAKILYEGIKQKTNNFSRDRFSANMLEATSIAMRYQQKNQQPSQNPMAN